MSRRPKLLIIVLFQNLAEEGRTYYARAPAPPLTGVLLAALTPPLVDVELLHEMVRPIDFDTDAEVVALSFMDFCTPHAIAVAGRFRALGKRVIAGGRGPTSALDGLTEHFDAVVVGEAERIWPEVVRDAVQGQLRNVYRAPVAPPLEDLPPPRYDLVEPEFAVPVVTEATRGCPYRCDFCQLTTSPSPYRRRPVADVVRDLRATSNLPLMKRKVAMLYDNNVGGDLAYAKELLREIAKLDLWALGVQFSFDCLYDAEFVELLAAAHCRMAFIGMESLHQPSLLAVRKRQNRVSEVAARFGELRARGILVFAGLIFGLEEDTPEYYRTLPELLDEAGPAAVLPSLAIPIPGTPLHQRLARQRRIIDSNPAHYDGDHVVFQPRHLRRMELIAAYAGVCWNFYGLASVVRRWWRVIVEHRRRSGLVAHVLGLLILSSIFLRLTLLQRHHAKSKIRELARRTPATAALSRSITSGAVPSPALRTEESEAVPAGRSDEACGLAGTVGERGPTCTLGSSER